MCLVPSLIPRLSIINVNCLILNSGYLSIYFFFLLDKFLISIIKPWHGHLCSFLNTGYPVGGNQIMVNNFEPPYFFQRNFRTSIVLAKLFSGPNIYYTNFNTSSHIKCIFLSKNSSPHILPLIFNFANFSAKLRIATRKLASLAHVFSASQEFGSEKPPYWYVRFFCC